MSFPGQHRWHARGAGSGAKASAAHRSHDGSLDVGGDIAEQPALALRHPASFCSAIAGHSAAAAASPGSALLPLPLLLPPLPLPLLRALSRGAVPTLHR